MYEKLCDLEAAGGPIRIALIGAGSMGLGIARQLAHTPGMVLVSITDINRDAALAAAKVYGGRFTFVEAGEAVPTDGSLLVGQEPFFGGPPLVPEADVVVEATNTVGFAARACLNAIDRGIHVVLMNAEVDLAFGPLLHQAAAEKGVVVTSDAGDQHGVLMRMIDEIKLWGFRVVMAGNIKGFLNRYATAASLANEAAERHLNPIQCCAYTDGTKLGVEMALVANATDLVPWVPGMEGPPLRTVQDVLGAFDFQKYGKRGAVEYILGAEPGGGVFVVGYCAEPLQQRYLQYYKLGDGPYYLFYRPYHLCHLETPWAIAQAALHHRPILRPTFGRVADVYAYAKRDIAAGEVVPHGIGGEHFYGLIDRCNRADSQGVVPIALLEGDNDWSPVIRRALRRDDPLRFDDVDLHESYLLALFQQQNAMAVAQCS